MRKPYPSELQDRVMIRLPDGVRDRLEAIAKRNKRTVTAEIVRSIEKHLADEEGVPNFADDALLDALKDIVTLKKQVAELEQRVSRSPKRARRAAAA